jgi:RimJ/RimL family protein N-acetyltransferase
MLTADYRIGCDLKILETDRLVIRHIVLDDASFMLGLLNDSTWLQFIGDRGVRTLDDAAHYISSGPLDMYSRLGFGFYIVELADSATPIGICGLAKRDYLQDVDIGFAMLPQYAGKGYAYESAKAVLDYAKTQLRLPRLVATTRPENTASAYLLQKLGLKFERVMTLPNHGRALNLFSIEFRPNDCAG